MEADWGCEAWYNPFAGKDFSDFHADVIAVDEEGRKRKRGSGSDTEGGESNATHEYVPAAKRTKFRTSTTATTEHSREDVSAGDAREERNVKAHKKIDRGSSKMQRGRRGRRNKRTKGSLILASRMLRYAHHLGEDPLRNMVFKFESANDYFAVLFRLIEEEAIATLQQAQHALTNTRKSSQRVTLSLSSLDPKCFAKANLLVAVFDVVSHVPPGFRAGQLFGLTRRGAPSIVALSFPGIEGRTFKLTSGAGSSDFGALGTQWSAVPLNTCVPLLRMADAIHSEPSPPFLHSFVNGKSQTHIVFSSESSEDEDGDEEEAALDTQVGILTQHLNRSQRSAVREVLRRQPRLHLLQGPPGTGKTTTLTALLRSLTSRGEHKARVLVCAPSNKAVQVIVASFLQSIEKSSGVFATCSRSLHLATDADDKVRIAWIGVEEMLPDEEAEGAESVLDAFTYTIPERLAGSLLTASQQIKTALECCQKNVCSPWNVARTVRVSHVEDCASALQALVETAKNAAILVKSANDRLRTDAPHTYKQSCVSLRRALKECANSCYSLRKTTEELLSAWPCVSVSLTDSVEASTTQLLSCAQLLRELRESVWSDMEREIINTADVIFSTLVSSGTFVLRVMPAVDVLVVDEAAQAIEGEIHIALSSGRPRRAVLAGDPSQLCSTVLSRAAEKAGYAVSVMERLMKAGHTYLYLDTQYRMHPQISAFPAGRFYSEKGLTNAACTSASPAGLHTGLPGPYCVVDVGDVEINRHNSFANDGEARAVTSLLGWLAASRGVNVASSDAVRVLTFYAAQVSSIRHAMVTGGVFAEVSTVDGSQGCEADVVLLSCVRSNSKQRVGFLSDFRRLNVALTRARKMLVVFCNVATLQSSGDESIALLVSDARHRGLLVSTSELAELVGGG